MVEHPSFHYLVLSVANCAFFSMFCFRSLLEFYCNQWITIRDINDVPSVRIQNLPAPTNSILRSFTFLKISFTVFLMARVQIYSV
jgi:hypothetical protein